MSERTIVDEQTVPGTPVTVTIEFQPKDEHLARLLGDKPGKGSWVDRWYVTRRPNGAPFVNYLHTARESETAIRAEANLLWADTIKRRNARRAQAIVRAGRS
jgi:hypothetical protein